MRELYDGGRFRLTSGYGTRVDPISGKPSTHNGIDVVGVDTKRVVSAAAGRVARSRRVIDPSNPTSEWGEYVAVAGDDGLVCYYCHLSERLTAEGERVKAGDVIGIEGSTGKSTGSHLHFEVRRGLTPVNAADYIGIANISGVYGGATHGELVAARCSLERRTVDYINAYPYAADLWRKLWQAMV